MVIGDCQNRVPIFSHYGKMPENIVAEKLLRVNYSVLKDQCADSMLHFSRVEGASKLGETSLQCAACSCQRRKPNNALSCQPFSIIHFTLPAGRKAVCGTEMSTYCLSPPSALGILKSTSLTYVTRVKQMSQGSRF